MIELLRNPRRLLLFLFEGSVVAILVLTAACIRFGDIDEGLRHKDALKQAILFATVVQGAFYYSGMYERGGPQGARATYERVLQALAVASVILLVVYYLIPRLALGRGVYLVAIALTTTMLPSWRLLYDTFVERSGFTRRVVILGTGPLAKELREIIQENTDLGLELAGMLGRDRSQLDFSLGVVGVYSDLYEIVSRETVDVVLVAYPDRRGTLPVDQLLEIKFRGVEVFEGVDFYERHTGKIYVRELKPSQLIFTEGFSARTTTRRLKRILDVVISSIGLLLAAPLMAMTCALIKLDSRGPILYRQVRAGEFGRLFTILKFRSMRVDAEKSGAQFAKENDERITRVGRFIRKTRLDELPQLWNVLKGEMSIVGPRPERPVFVEQLEQQVPYFKQRLYVKPGITGHAQVRCRYGASAEDMLEKLQFDLYYIKSYSVLFDLSIMLDTIKVVLLRIGAR